MTLTRARQILKEDAIGKTDQEIEQILNAANYFADQFITKATQLVKVGGKNALENWPKKRG